MTHEKGLRRRHASSRGSLLDLFFNPRSIAVIGASASPGKAGHNVMQHLIEGGYQGEIIPVNPRGAPILGRTCVPSLGDLEHPVDLAFIALPAGAVSEALQGCADAGAKAAIIGASGFAELGTKAGHLAQAQLAGIGKATGMRLLGPNTNGLVSTGSQLALGFNVCFPEAITKPGPVSIVSHSGALFDAVSRRLAHSNLGLAHFIAMGNEMDVTMTEMLAALAQDPATKVIGLMLEALDDAEEFRQAAAKAHQNGKRVVVLKIGRSQAGIGAALAHSSRLAGGTRAYEAICKEAGIPIVPTIEAFTTACAILATSEKTSDWSTPLVCLSSSGAGGALMADAATDKGLSLAGGASGEWSEAAEKRLAQLNTRARIRHPIDLGNLVQWSELTQVLDALDTEACGTLVAFVHMAPHRQFAEGLLGALSARRKTKNGAVIVLAPGELDKTLSERYAEAGILVSNETSSLFDALKALAIAGAPQDLPPGRVIDNPKRREDVDNLLRAAHIGNAGAMNEFDSAVVFTRMGISMADARIVTNTAAAQDAANELGFPVVLKGLTADISHKAAEGLVELDLRDAQSVQDAFARLRGKSDAHSEFSVLVQPMIAGVIEAIAAITKDPQLGHFLVFGSGGAEVEQLDDADMIPLPIENARLRELVGRSGLARRLEAELANKGQFAIGQLSQTLEALAALASEQPHNIDAAEINPLVFVAGGQAMGVDALIVPNTTGTAT